MLLRVIDYVGNPGGGVRFTVEMLRGLRRRVRPQIELVSHAEALERYASLLGTDRDVRLLDVPPVDAWRSRTLMAGIPGAGPLNMLLGTARFHHVVAGDLLDGADTVWFPWVHRHRIPWARAGRVVATLHDVITIQFPEVAPAWLRRNERETVREWLASDARIAITSNATATTLDSMFGVPRERLEVIPLSGSHQRPAGAGARRTFAFTRSEYLLAPINITPHKNPEVLLRGLGRTGERHPLVLTGSGMDLWPPRSARARKLVGLAEQSGFTRDQSIFALGYVDDRAYEQLLDGAWALVMPTLAEGGGSFPVLEAMTAGIPVIASDIPVMREMVQRTGGQILWFDPRDPADLAAKLAELEAGYAEYRLRAERQARSLRLRTWADVAGDYARLMRLT
ncbi:glycosyltransferase [Anaeromyxobacter sp. PSR-1]|uniref:glycosyltransferase n=1 Tax=Anaeromyxobacter sp. PSR-1 TaxID=1300915 RepID=UPI0005DE121B|nr:glycosyltransferase [Anaeromyxobacter sp. PSR-1]GAO03158.1 D-inositol-3-phosphate glycosyltransferase [Anaeromyxobacter sp. PSR-1]